MATSDSPAWIAAATAAAVRLAAEAGAEVDDVLRHGDAPADLLAQQIVRLRQSAEIAEVASDLAVLLWAECEDVPPIATILEEPETQAALVAVAEARRQAAARLAGGGQPLETVPKLHWADADGRVLSLDPRSPTGESEPARPRRKPVAEPASPALVPAPHPAMAPAAVPVRRTGAVIAGAAAAAIVLFGRRLRRA